MKIINAFNRLKAIYRLLLCLLLATLFYLLVPASKMNGFTHLLFAWDIFSICMILLSWLTFFTTGPNQIRNLAQIQDESRTITFIIVLISNIASMLGVLLLLVSKDESKISVEIALIVALTGMAFSWILVHTLFTLRYAHLYYGNSSEDSNTKAGGLNFPQEKNPDYIDFAYFSFVLGMTFQVSDVEITSRRLRRLALLHGIFSFGFNTIIVAITINVIAGLKK